MRGKEKLMTLLGSAVLLGLGAEGITPAHGGEGKCAGMNRGAQQKTKEMTCGGPGGCGGKMKAKEATCAGMEKGTKEKAKKKVKKNKEMTCGGPGGCGGKMKTEEGSKS